MVFHSIYRFLLDGLRDFMTDDGATLGAALSFYTALALAPLLMIVMAAAGLIGAEAQSHLIRQIQHVVGPQISEFIQLVIRNAQEHRGTGTLSAVVGVLTLFISASGVFAQLQYSMNTIWDVHVKPGHDVMFFIRQRLLSFAMMAVVALLSVASLTLSTVLSYLFSGTAAAWLWVDFLGSLVAYSLVFALIFKLLPDVELAWRDVWGGSVVTAVLFVAGKFAIGKYLGYTSIGSAYGAAGSLVVLLLWLYYTSQIVFFGAELTQVYARNHGSGLIPKSHALLNADTKHMKRARASENRRTVGH
jgi:membrane protein